MKTVLKIGLGIFLGGALLIGACAVLLAAEPELEGTGGKATDAGDDYCTAEKQDELAALELGAGETINSPRLLRRATRRFLRENRDAPTGAWCVDQELEFLIDVWNGYRGDDRFPESAEQVRELREFERRR
jgi:hypothetical protein